MNAVGSVAVLPARTPVGVEVVGTIMDPADATKLDTSCCLQKCER